MAAKPQAIVTAAQLGAVLQSARKARGLSQSRLGVRLDLSQTRISELELAPGTLSVDQLLALCAQLGLQLSVQARNDQAQAAAATDW